MKKQIKLIFLLLLTIIFSQITTAYFGNQWIEGESKSTKDPLYIDMPDEVHQMVPTTVKVYINDPIILENAQYAEIEPGNSNAYMLSGNKFSLIGGGAFRKTMVYNGEKSFEFGFRPTDRIGLSNSVKVTFYMAKKAPSKEQVDTRDEESPFFGYDCHWETNDLLCSEEEGCQICNHPVGLVMKYFMVSETDESVSIPTRVDFTDRKKERESTIVGSQDLYYKEEKQYISNGNEYTSNERYYIGLDIWEMDTTFEEYKENDLDGYTGESENVDNPYVTVNDIFASGPEVTGKAYEKVYNKPPNTKNSAASAEIHYQLHAEMSPIGSGVMRIKASRYTVFEKGTSSDGELEAIRNDVLNMLSSYKLSKGKIIDVEKKDYMKPIWNVRGEPKEEETTDTHYVTGHITNYFDHPMRYMEVIAKIDGVIYEGITDEDGIYKILLVGLELKEDEKKDVVILAKFNYVRDSKNYFNIFFRKPNNRYSLVQATKKGTLVEGEHLQIDFRMDGEGDFTTNIPNKEDLKHYSLNYFHTAESVEFVLETLKEDMDYKLPVTVYVGNQDKKTLYNPSDSRILISADDASLSDSDRPDNREYHEFMHALMYDIYNTWPEDRRLPGTVNHNGFHNPSTADSYMEGFAEFMAMVISDEMGEPNPQLYAGFGSMDQNYKMWDGKGFDE
ncbi:hypothetical protein HOD20_08045, partial [archaeon]|nr:hypothetical protein [archaeon]MBT4647389.1 hypothetical protein [archaeon]MBT6821392.1 hypothetical protein [archaeon]